MALDKTSRGLTEKRIRDAKPGPKTVILWDESLKGFGVRVTPAGAKSYILNYRVAGRGTPGDPRPVLRSLSEGGTRASRPRAYLHPRR